MPGPFWEYDTSGSDHLRPCVDPRRRGVTTLLFKWLKQPVVLGYIVAGFLCSGNFLLQGVSNMGNVDIWAEIGIIFLLFSLGLEFSFKKLMNVGGPALMTALVVIVGMMCSGFMAGRALGWTSTDSIFLGGMLSMSSTDDHYQGIRRSGAPQPEVHVAGCSGCWWSKTCSP